MWAWAPPRTRRELRSGTWTSTWKSTSPQAAAPLPASGPWQKDHHGLVDLSFGFEDGTFTPWALQGSLPQDCGGRSTGLKVWEHTVPTGRWATGLGVRSQGHFGVVDIILRVCIIPVPLTPLLATAPLASDTNEAGAAWEIVQETRLPGRDGPQ